MNWTPPTDAEKAANPTKPQRKMGGKTFHYHFRKRKWFVVKSGTNPGTTTPSTPGVNLSVTNPVTHPVQTPGVPPGPPVTTPVIAPAPSPPPQPRVQFTADQREQVLNEANNALRQTLSQWF